jgi:hypothetical protein
MSFVKAANRAVVRPTCNLLLFAAPAPLYAFWPLADRQNSDYLGA